jgi:hypothetical protein
LTIATAVLALTIAASALAAFGSLPSDGSKVNNDPTAGIDPAQSVSAEEPTNADVVGGALTAGGKAVPWSIFRQQEAGGSKDQVFVRAFKDGAWATQGNGTLDGASSASATFRASLNFNKTEDGEAPAIDFAGAGRTVPWATWYEDTPGTGFNEENIFASRFDKVQNKWQFAGQSRGTGGGAVPIPSLNIHTDKEAENPSVAGGSAADPTKPGPWITWQEKGVGPTTDQIFVVKPIGPGSTNCTGVKPAAANPAAAPVGGFCWQQVGTDRETGDPSLNVDRTREGIEPDIAFTGPNDAVPWVVWYETGASGDGLLGNDMVFAAKGVNDATADGGFHWVTVGNAGQGVLDNSAHGGPCGASQDAEKACSLNKNPVNGAEDPRVAAGTMNPQNPTVPWVAWDEDLNGTDQIFVSRLVGAGATAHFELANNGQPISLGSNPSIRPDITFSGHTPYVSWREDIGGGVEKGFYGHFVNAANPTFVLDASNVPLTPSSTANVREPISSTCIATPFNGDGSACQGGAIGTPFFLFTNGTSTRGLFAQAYEPSGIDTGAATNVSGGSATLNGSVDPGGAATAVHFDFGPTPAYGSSTAVQRLGPANGTTAFSAAVNGLPAGGTVHYRAVAQSDFATIVGPDRTIGPAGGGGNPGANDEPHSKILGLSHKVKAKKLKSFHGSASDSNGIARVQFGLIRLANGAKLAKKHAACFVLRSNGHLKKVKVGKRSRCSRPALVRAKGTKRWSLKLKGKLPRGSYVAFSQAVDKTGKKETHFSTHRGNERKFRVT